MTRITFAAGFLLLALTGGCLLSACNPKKQSIKLPMTIEYTVSAEDTGALLLVNTYYANRFNYTMFDSARFMSERTALIGDFTNWFDGQSLFIRETNGGYCSCSKVSGRVLDYWFDNFDPPVITRGASFKRGNTDVYEAFFIREETDTTWMVIDASLPNLWFDFPWLPGLPVEYSYALRGARVSYVADIPTVGDVKFNPSGYDENCVRVPAEAWAGISPESELGQMSSAIWLYGFLIDEDDNLLNGTVTVESNRRGVINRAQMQLDRGSFDLELLRGERYVLEFAAPNKTRKRIDLDCAKVPDSDDGYLLDVNVQLFETQSLELRRYLELNPVLGLKYLPDSANFVVDRELVERAANDIMMMRSREQGGGRQRP